MQNYVKMFLFAVLSAGLFFVSACEPDRSEGENESVQNGEVPDKPDMLYMWVNDSTEQFNSVRSITEKYTEETGIEVELTRIPIHDQAETFALDGPAGTGPDIYFQPHDNVAGLAIQNLVEPIELEQEVEERFTDESIEAMSYEGELYGVPFVSETYAMVYNRELVPDPPETMAELEAIAEDLTDSDNNQYGFLAEMAETYFAYPFLTGYGGYIFGETEDGYDTEDIGLNNEGAVEGAAKIQSWFENGWIPTTIDGDIQNGLFVEGNVGLSITGPWSIVDYTNGIGEDNVRTAPLPQLSNGEPAVSLSGTKSWVMSPYSDDKYWALDLMLFMTEDENNMQYFREAGEMPAVEALLEDPEITENEILSGFAEQILQSDPIPNIPEIDIVWDVMEDHLQFIAEGEDPQELLDEAVKEINQNMELTGQ